jgi:NADH-quinone oxidoreductase subunit J
MLSMAISISADTITTVLFYVFGLLAAGSGLGVVISRNIVRTAVFLLGALVGVGGLYFLLNAEFLAAVQLVVYAGGTLILIIFGVMLTSKSPFSRFEPKLGEVIIAISIGSILLFALVMGILRTTFASQELNVTTYPLVTLGQVLLGDYLIPFELASVLLLVVMIGAAYLAKGRRDVSEKPARTEASETMRKWS